MAKAKRPPQTKKKLGGPRISEGGPRRDKAAAVDDVQGRLGNASAVVLTEYRGMTVGELASLRASLREAGGEYKVYKNTLATIAARNIGLEDLAGQLEGPTAFAFAEGDPVVLAKKLADFAKKVPALVIKGGLLDKKVLSPKDVNNLSSLESREVMLAKAAGMFITPIQQVANLFAAGFNQMGAVLVQLRDKLPAEGTAAPAAAAPEAAAPDASAPEAAALEAGAPETAAADVTPAPETPSAGEEARAAEAEADAVEAGTTPDQSGDETTEG